MLLIQLVLNMSKNFNLGLSQSLGGLVFAKDMDSQTVEGKGGTLAVIIQFRSKKDAVDAYKSSEYQELSNLRWANSKDTNITIMEGSLTH